MYRRTFNAWLGALVCSAVGRSRAASASEAKTFIDAAFRMRADAIASGDQPYGAVVVLRGEIIGFGPSRVVLKRDETAHAEREAIRDAQSKVGPDLSGCVMYSTSRPCRDCQAAASKAKISRMYFGIDGADADEPK
jgi:tRNA(Arg) A34 adenosine deaminase TadA